jgi:hypothetical protein
LRRNPPALALNAGDRLNLGSTSIASQADVIIDHSKMLISIPNSYRNAFEEVFPVIIHLQQD